MGNWEWRESDVKAKETKVEVHLFTILPQRSIKD